MRYFINFDKTVNQFIPHYLGGRKLILYLQALLQPLQTLNNAYSEWAKETRIEASMTSQIYKLEWFLNRKFSKYFIDVTNRITLTNTTSNGLALYRQNADIPLIENPILVEQKNHTSEDPVLYHAGEFPDSSRYSFIVSTPMVDTAKITEKEYLSQLTYWIDRYRIAGKTYKIKFQ